MSEKIADDVEWHYIGGKEPLRGKQAMMEQFASMADVDLKVDVHDVVANDQHIIALAEADATRNGKNLKYRTAEIFDVENGIVKKRWAFSDDTDAIIKFFA
jgi:hypothetical protein